MDRKIFFLRAMYHQLWHMLDNSEINVSNGMISIEEEDFNKLEFIIEKFEDEFPHLVHGEENWYENWENI